MAERVDARLGVGGELGQRREHDARRSRARPTAARPRASPRRRARPRPGRPRPRRPAIPSLVSPETSADSSARGSHSAGTPSAAQTSSLQRPARDVEQQRARGVGDVDRPLAATASAARSPWAAGCARPARGPRARASRSHSSFGAVKPVSARLPVAAISSSSPIRDSISSHSAPVRWSFQRIAGRSTCSSASSATSPCIWPDRPIPATSPRAELLERLLRRRHQSSGSCSAQPGFGVESPYSSSARPTTSPSSEMASALRPLVPTSIPTATLMPPAPPAPRRRARRPGPRPCATAPRAAPRRRSAPRCRR